MEKGPTEQVAHFSLDLDLLLDLIVRKTITKDISGIMKLFLGNETCPIERFHFIFETLLLHYIKDSLSDTILGLQNCVT